MLTYLRCLIISAQSSMWSRLLSKIFSQIFLRFLVFDGLLFLVLWFIGSKFEWDFTCVCHWYETVIEWIVFTLVQHLWIPSMILPMSFRYCQSTEWWPHCNHFVTISGQGLYQQGKLVRVQSNKNPFWKQSCWLIWFVRYWSLFSCHKTIVWLVEDEGLSDDYLRD